MWLAKSERGRRWSRGRSSGRDEAWVGWDLETAGGELLSGLLVEEDEAGVTLRTTLGEDRRVARSQIAALRSSGVSLMPEEMEVEPGVEGMADLLAFLEQAPR